MCSQSRSLSLEPCSVCSVPEALTQGERCPVVADVEAGLEAARSCAEPEHGRPGEACRAGPIWLAGVCPSISICTVKCSRP